MSIVIDLNDKYDISSISQVSTFDIVSENIAILSPNLLLSQFKTDAHKITNGYSC